MTLNLPTRPQAVLKFHAVLKDKLKDRNDGRRKPRLIHDVFALPMKPSAVPVVSDTARPLVDLIVTLRAYQNKHTNSATLHPIGHTNLLITMTGVLGIYFDWMLYHPFSNSKGELFDFATDDDFLDTYSHYLKQAQQRQQRDEAEARRLASRPRRYAPPVSNPGQKYSVTDPKHLTLMLEEAHKRRRAKALERRPKPVKPDPARNAAISAAADLAVENLIQGITK